MTASPALARALAADRTGYNAKVVQARNRWPDFDTGAFSGFLLDTVDPLLVAVDATNSDRVHAVATVAYDFAVELVAQRLVGVDALQSWVAQAWQEVAPRYPALLAAEPAAVLGSLSNAVIQLARWPQVRVAEWLTGMQTHAHDVENLEQLRALGQLLAWLAGMAHFRTGALAAADRLPRALALAVLGARTDADWPALRAAIQEDPWLTPHGCAHELPVDGMHIGAFSGFGGPFIQPPTLRATEEGFMVASGDRHYLLLADIHGAVLLPATQTQFDAAMHEPAPVPRLHAVALAWPETVGACNSHTLAITSPYSHVIALFPRS